ncbi:hypothetical protein H310_14936 [Aphanomyces invadans]|uniref:Uncharacterized protein n=1 Tax=Aphanomyces invadans TaxID=157072 RepID=A0A024T8E3_9STRA|nr:hypothetical protein H310_14936 [Aphanomyces invadans]ETV90234.1 hypothetical protein H310_14936 [Aphanomyces invadans]|eukprot:XP_008881135.1 hypothetical protein H310_14936 [Aphanomyces invadans]
MPSQPTAVIADRPRNPRGPKGGKTHLDLEERRSIYESQLAVSSSGTLPRGAIVSLPSSTNATPTLCLAYGHVDGAPSERATFVPMLHQKSEGILVAKKRARVMTSMTRYDKCPRPRGRR